MKNLCFGLVVFSFSSLAMASTTESKKIIDTSIEKLRRIEKVENNRSKGTKLWIASTREAELWGSMIKAYDFLMYHQIKERYIFMYGAAKAASIRNPEARQIALSSWLIGENRRLLSLGLSGSFNSRWSQLNQALSENILDMKESGRLPETTFSADLKNVITSLSAVDLKETAPAKLSQAPVGTSNINFKHILYTFLSSGVLFGLVAFSLKKKRANSSLEEVKIMNTEQAMPEAQAPLISATRAPDLETICQNFLDENKHLLEVAKVNISPRSRSPFNTTMMIPAEEVKESLQGLLKGTLAIVNSSSKMGSQLEWNCFEQNGRLSLEFTVHGVECDNHSLYLNTLVDGDGSAPAHFGRAERSLAAYLATVRVRKAAKKTVISLGMDSDISAMTN